MSFLDLDVVEMHLSTGKTLPLRATVAASGNKYFGLLRLLKNGQRKFIRYGVNVSPDLVGDVKEIKDIRVPDAGITVKVKHDVNEKGKPRATAEQTFTGPDGNEWVFSFRATLTNPDAVNLSGAIRRQGGNGGGTSVQDAL